MAIIRIKESSGGRMSIQPKQSEADTKLSLQFQPSWHQDIIKSLSQTGKASSIVPYHIGTSNEQVVTSLSSQTGIPFKPLDQARYEDTIEKTLSQISLETGIRFERVGNAGSSILSIWLIDGDLPGTRGSADGVSIQYNNGKNYWTDVYWNTRSIGAADANKYVGTLLRHEIGHSFGFSHPANDGNNKNFNTADTLMSYLPEWWTPEAYLPQEYNSAEISVLKSFYQSTVAQLPPVPIRLDIDKTKSQQDTLEGVDPGLSKFLWGDETQNNMRTNRSLGAQHSNNSDFIILTNGTYSAPSGLGKDTYFITQQFIDNLTGFVVIPDFDPRCDKFAYAGDISDTSGFRFGSLGDMPALFNEDNLLAVFGLHDPNTPVPFDTSGLAEGFLDSFNRQVGISLAPLF